MVASVLQAASSVYREAYARNEHSTTESQARRPKRLSTNYQSRKLIMRPTSRVLSTLCLALATPTLAIGPWLVCDTNEFVEKLWPTYAAAHAAAVAALRNDAAPGSWRGHRYLVCSMSNRGLGNKLLFELMPCARVAFATGRALVVRTERHIAEALGGVDFAAAPGEAPAIAWLAPGLADACPGSPGSCQSHELVCDRRRPAHLPALCGRRLGHP